MVDGIRLWSRGIIFAVIITIVIEMILPENNSRKYIKVVLGMFVVYSIISPMFKYFSGKDVDNLIDSSEEMLQTSSKSIDLVDEYAGKTEFTIRNIYSQNLQKEIQSYLENKGFIAEQIKIKIANDDSYNIEQVDIKIKEKVESKNEEKQVQSVVDTIKYIVISVEQTKNQSDVIDENDKSMIKSVIQENFRN
ncbi:MAG: stage III sporulation protein AF [Clostridia bacterium]|nr:stage III sporulation protein AF [Clostridia bacterium]